MVSADTANDARSIIVMEESILSSDITNSLRGNDPYGGEHLVSSQPYYESTQSDTHSPPQTQLGSWLHNVRFYGTPAYSKRANRLLLVFNSPEELPDLYESHVLNLPLIRIVVQPPLYRP